jgi:DNA end-binding protein Ku
MASSVWKGHLTFGLVSFPIRLFSAARSETISFNLLHKDDHSRIRQVVYCQAEDKPVSRSELVKGYEYEKDHYVEIEDEDIKKVAPKTAKVMEILEFVKADDVDPVYLESSYYVAPDEGGEKPYALLFQALRESKYFALAKVAMHNREHIIVLRPGAKGILSHTMFYQDEIRQVDEFRTDTSLVKEKELAMAKMLISSLEAEFEPQKYHDNYRANLQQMIEAKVAGQKRGGDSGNSRGAGDRHHGSPQEEPRREAETCERGDGSRRRRYRRGTGGSGRAQEAGAQDELRLDVFVYRVRSPGLGRAVRECPRLTA